LEHKKWYVSEHHDGYRTTLLSFGAAISKTIPR
jgi:hypothetical protein